MSKPLIKSIGPTLLRPASGVQGYPFGARYDHGVPGRAAA